MYCCIAAFSALLLLIPTRYVWAFFSFETSREWVCTQFFTKEGASDEAKMYIHSCAPKKWASIRDDVRVWHHAN